MIILKRYKVTDMRKFKRFMFLTVLLFSMISFTSILTYKAYSKDIQRFDYVSVQQGDTLWSIAKHYSSGKDIREVIYEISKLNNIHNRPIRPGDLIKIPLN
ncbi:MAG TPA: LysM peptidoglycan-binding domain-containing protein [Sedimentibacter sp.]|jgi:hypothetical protein|nr:LysM peptidoglycan-binding domain-containing protein [Sedimentibacter sp.]HHZ00835.1 LysM peptidoglycan-binding domain-containing protein [Tissierellia bacterium]HOK48981.1 LysM peptidoglycan-binding domain-containing protein [Sedimentibacter sp.]HOW22084.1 LysM peptidoglycan-binding domain-containing protein [Sedimentibacter sp.]HRC80207.1 LysM peptidoglycan-binding domain-containing protein [Sedimentibacter sp.]